MPGTYHPAFEQELAYRLPEFGWKHGWLTDITFTTN